MEVTEEGKTEISSSIHYFFCDKITINNITLLFVSHATFRCEIRLLFIGNTV